MIMDYWHFWHTETILDCWNYPLSKDLVYSVPQFEQLKENEREDWILENICCEDNLSVMITEYENSYFAFELLHNDSNPIPKAIDGNIVRVIGENTFRYFEIVDEHHCMFECDVYPDLTLPDGIKYIMSRTFSRQKKLQTITLPDSLIGIGEACFSFSGLKEITLPDSIECVSAFMFSNCPNLQSVKLGNHTVSIKEGAFEKCISLSGLLFPPSLQEIGDRSFLDSGMGITLLPHGLKTIGKEAFANCKNLLYCFIPKTVTFIGEDAFKNAPPDFFLLTPKDSYAYQWAVSNNCKYSIVDL